MVLILIFLPLLSSICIGFFGRFLGKTYGSKFVGILMATTVILSAYNVYIFLSTNTVKNIVICEWITSDFLIISWGFLIDSLSAIMLFVVCFISFVVHLYSLSYMETDPHQLRFYSYLSLFTFFMILLVTANNFLQMFVGWEGVGVCSFLLINFWFTRIQANKAAIKAMIINRIGDFSLIIGIFLIYAIFNSINYNVVFSLTYLFTNETYWISDIRVLNLIAFFIFIGAVGKSAQIGLHSWLPDAMEGPTPVSALLHSATMVTAGVFLLIRISPLLEYAEPILFLITIVGALTSFFAATIGLFQNDIKRIIAYSTCSQLGYMIFSCGLSNYTTSFFHLFNHAFFKALLFLCSGAIIHALYDEQDIRKMGGLKNLMPITYISMLIGSLALIGFPFLSGFYSKDLILEFAFSLNKTESLFAYILGSFSAFCTAFYSFRLLYLVFLTSFNGFRSSLIQIHEASTPILSSFLFLIFPSIFIGFYTKNIFVGPGTTFWQTAIFNDANKYSLIESEFIISSAKQFPLICTFFGILSCILIFYLTNLYNLKFKLTTIGLIFYNFFNRKWYLDKFNNLYISNTVLISYFYTYYIIDRGFLEQLGPNLMSKTLTHFPRRYTNYLYNKTTFGLLSGSLIAFMCFFFIWGFYFIFINNNSITFISSVIADLIFFLILWIINKNFLEYYKPTKITLKQKFEKLYLILTKFWNKVQHTIKKF